MVKKIRLLRYQLTKNLLQVIGKITFVFMSLFFLMLYVYLILLLYDFAIDLNGNLSIQISIKRYTVIIFKNIYKNSELGLKEINIQDIRLNNLIFFY